MLSLVHFHFLGFSFEKREFAQLTRLFFFLLGRVCVTDCPCSFKQASRIFSKSH